MNRRVFEPRPDTTVAQRRQSIRLALAVLAAGCLALWYLKQAQAPAPRPNPPVTVNHAR